MVRAVVGTLLEVGEGKLEPSDITGILESKDRSRAGQNVPPYGLYFVEAGYTIWAERER
jgi:tRNA pseudouridine38-40 synthase